MLLVNIWGKQVEFILNQAKLEFWMHRNSILPGGTQILDWYPCLNTGLRRQTPLNAWVAMEKYPLKAWIYVVYFSLKHPFSRVIRQNFGKSTLWKNSFLFWADFTSISARTRVHAPVSKKQPTRFLVHTWVPKSNSSCPTGKNSLPIRFVIKKYTIFVLKL